MELTYSRDKQEPSSWRALQLGEWSPTVDKFPHSRESSHTIREFAAGVLIDAIISDCNYFNFVTVSTYHQYVGQLREKGQLAQPQRTFVGQFGAIYLKVCTHLDVLLAQVLIVASWHH